MVTKRTQELKEKSAAHVFHSFGMVVDKPEIIWEKGKGVTLWDTDGNEYLDICSFFQCCNLGYGRKELHNAALEQMNQLEYATTISPYGNIPTIEYATELAKVTPKNINRFFFNTGGTEANETAFKIAKFYWYMKGKPTKYKIICLKDAYHGSGFLTGSLSGWVNMRNYFGPEAAGVVRIPNYNCYRPSPGFEGPDGVIKAAKYLETAIDQEGEDSVAAFITEPEQGWAGGIPAPPEYFPIIREICTRRNVLWIDDEVMSGFCRTGKMFAVEHWNLEPDIMTMGKGI
ncbi:MAG: aspartate aminotransferase family protein, partial [Anaerolineales bacterium]|nr:aspartate aminotransferase family protein [Anaerolineales bacterium]